jgi:predicted GIY-YIG superfamily endonuclease
MSKGYTIYLLHFEPRFKHAGHYLGVTRNGRDVAARFKEHLEGKGAVLTRYAKKAGCEISLARVWFNQEFASERRMKGRSLAPLCPMCREASNGRSVARRGKKDSKDAHTKGNERALPIIQGSQHMPVCRQSDSGGQAHYASS